MALLAENIAMSCDSISKNDSIFAELLLHFLLQNCTREELVYTAGWQEALLKLIMYFRPSFKSLCVCVCVQKSLFVVILTWLRI